MIEKMKFVSITGPSNDIDRMINQYLFKYDIHLENAMTELGSSKNLLPYVEANPYKALLSKGSELISYLDSKDITYSDITVDVAEKIILDTTNQIKELSGQIEKLETVRKDYQDTYDKISPFADINYDINYILNMDHIKFRFGRVPISYYQKLELYTDNNDLSIFIKCKTDKDYVWGIYFVPAVKADRIDASYTSLHFERTYFPDTHGGTPKKACSDYQKSIDDITAQIDELNSKITTILQSSKNDIYSAYDRIQTAHNNFDVRKMATHTNNDGVKYYFMCGWMTAHDAKCFEEEIKSDENVICMVEDEAEISKKTPPTKLKNPSIVKPFEMYIRMYGLPAYNEIDPTIFVALTYSFIFGAMFGDVGQGLCLLIGGFLLYRIKKIPLAGIISTCGIFSVLFGFLFGSIFGYEDKIDALWLKPGENMTKVPLIGRLNTVFVVAIGFGMALVLVTMIFHIINGIKQGNLIDKLFDTNALAGLVFYGTLTYTAVMLVLGKKIPPAGVLLVLFIVPLIVIGLKEPLTHMITRTKPAEKTGVVMFFVQTFFELFEVLLSYFSNTLSFIRIGAFAVSHASMMEVVLMLGNAHSSSPSWIVIVLGNIFVMGLEGLIVGIQVLRLEYYELFSRYYKGNGYEFKPFKHVSNKTNQ